MYKWGWAMALGLLACSLGGLQVWAETHTSPAGSLDGTAWSVKVTPDEIAKKQGEKPSGDSLIFQDGKVTSTACVKYGFAASPYTVSKLGEQWTFKAEQVSSTDGKTVWAAAITGNSIKGTMDWTKKNGTVLHYTFEGTKTARAHVS